MGGNNSTAHKDKSEKKKVVIVGGSFAGLAAAEHLWTDFDVTLIDKNSFFEYCCMNARALVKESYIDELIVPYSDIVKTSGNKLTFIQGTLEMVNANNTIDIRRPGNQQFDPVVFDYLIIATGGQYTFPIKDFEVTTVEARRNKISEELHRIKEAGSILVVGGGAVGVEVMGELVSLFSDKD